MTSQGFPMSGLRYTDKEKDIISRASHQTLDGKFQKQSFAISMRLYHYDFHISPSTSKWVQYHCCNPLSKQNIISCKGFIQSRGDPDNISRILYQVYIVVYTLWIGQNLLEQEKYNSINERNQFVWPLLRKSQCVFRTVPQFQQSMLRHCESNPKGSDTNILLSSEVS